ncbi:Uncharacterised protein [Streptococcus pneumoniae]|nr:Uncharacterised protein [Streptococcus pneumoniae]
MKKILLSTVALLSLVASLLANNPVSAQESSSQAIIVSQVEVG